MTDGPASTSILIVLGALAMLGISLRADVASSLAVLIATALLGFAIYLKRSAYPRSHSVKSLHLTLLVVVVIFAGVSALGLPPRGIGPTNDALEQLPSLVWVLLALYIYLAKRTLELSSRAVVVGVILAFTAAVGVIHIAATDGVGLDVLALHRQTAEALQHGSNPYTDAVTVDDGAPTAAPGDVIEGYVYPPITAVFYSLGEWIASDPRYTSLVGWVVYLAVLGSWAVRRGGKASLLLVVAMAALPSWPLVLRAGWTEPLTLALAALAFHQWGRPVVSGVFLGMTLGSKQYFVVTAPLIALYRDSAWFRRAVWTALIAAGTVGLAFAVDFEAFWSAAILFHLSTPVRPDSLNLVGILAAADVNINLPSALPILVGLAASVLAARWARDRAQFFLGMAFTLAISFVVSSQAFPNYWFLIAGLSGLVAMSGMQTVICRESGADVPQRRVGNVP